MPAPFDCTVILLDARAGRWVDAPALWRELARGARAHGPVYVVAAMLDEPGARWGDDPGDDPGRPAIVLVGKDLSEASRREAHGCLRDRGVMRPLVVLVDPAQADLGVEMFAGRKLALLGAPAGSDDHLARVSRYVTHADAVCFESESAARTIADSCALPDRVLLLPPDPVHAAREVLEHARLELPPVHGPGPRLNVLVLYDSYYRYVGTIRDYLQSFLLYSHHRYWFVNATHEARCVFDLSKFDAVLIHYSVRMCLDQHIAPEFASAVRGFGGLKLLCIQDEYDHVEMTRSWIGRLGIHVVFTCVPDAGGIEKVYPRARFAWTRFITVLTGYVAESALAIPFGRPLSERKTEIGYRGRALPYFYGDLGHEKLVIGQRVKELCAQRGVSCDIEWTEDKRIYGRDWYHWLGSCRGTLGAESGANVFDWDGTLRERVTRAVKRRPDMSYAQAREEFLAGREGEVRMNQVSPRIFEAIATRTALILFEGTYSGVVRPNEHYIPLKRDFSNFDEVVAKLRDDAFVHELTARAYRDVIASGKYSYQAFVAMIDGVIAQQRVRSRGWHLASIYGGYERDGETGDTFELPPGAWCLPHESVSATVEKRHLPSDALVPPLLSRLWRKHVPKRYRQRIFPIVAPVFERARDTRVGIMKLLGR